jgi:hypothetical protein
MMIGNVVESIRAIVNEDGGNRSIIYVYLAVIPCLSFSMESTDSLLVIGPSFSLEAQEIRFFHAVTVR